MAALNNTGNASRAGWGWKGGGEGGRERGRVSISLHLTIMYLPVTSVARPKPRLSVSATSRFFSHGTAAVVTGETNTKRDLFFNRVL